MTKSALLLCSGLILLVLGGCRTMKQEIDAAAEKEAIAKVVHASIGWAATKDTVLSYSCYAHEPELFWFSPRDDGTLHGFDQFVETTEGFFMRDEFKAIRYEIRELEINLARSGEVAWYHARLDDFNEWNGAPANWEDVRWTGVLEKRDGRWVIVQMHFSKPSDRA